MAAPPGFQLYINSYIEGLAGQFCVPGLHEIESLEEEQVCAVLSRMHVSLVRFIRNVVCTAHRPLSLLCEQQLRERLQCERSSEMVQNLYSELDKIREALLSWIDMVISRKEQTNQEEIKDLEKQLGVEELKNHKAFEQIVAKLNIKAAQINNNIMLKLTDKILIDAGSHAMFRGINTTELNVFCFPGIDNTATFYCKDKFPQLRVLEDEFQTIQHEYLDFTHSEAYTSPGISFPLENVQHNWKTLWLVVGGQINERNCSFFPKTTAILKQIPRITREVLFSVLLPGAFIPTHRGNMNTTLRIHLGICGLHDCGLKVGDDIIQQQEGKVVIFDDFQMHSAWNNAKVPRVVLILDIIHPDLTEEQYNEYAETIHKVTVESEAGKALYDEITQLSQN